MPVLAKFGQIFVTAAKCLSYPWNDASVIFQAPEALGQAGIFHFAFSHGQNNEQSSFWWKLFPRDVKVRKQNKPNQTTKLNQDLLKVNPLICELWSANQATSVRAVTSCSQPECRIVKRWKSIFLCAAFIIPKGTQTVRVIPFSNQGREAWVRWLLKTYGYLWADDFWRGKAGWSDRPWVPVRAGQGLYPPCPRGSCGDTFSLLQQQCHVLKGFVLSEIASLLSPLFPVIWMFIKKLLCGLKFLMLKTNNLS